MGGPSIEQRQVAIANEPAGEHFYGRRYFVKKTRFWGYVRKPQEAWSKAKLVIIREDRMKAPDRLHEDGPKFQRYGYDSNYEYLLRGFYTGKEAYDPNSNQFLPEFMLTSYELKNSKPGWLFSPKDKYDIYRITLRPN